MEKIIKAFVMIVFVMLFFASCVYISRPMSMYAWSYTHAENFLPGDTIPEYFPLVVATKSSVTNRYEEFHFVRWNKLDTFQQAHPDYSFVLPSGEHRFRISEKGSAVEASVKFSANEEAQESQLIDIEYLGDNYNYFGKYSASKQKIVPQSLRHLHAMDSFAIMGIALVFTLALSFVFKRVVIWILRRIGMQLNVKQRSIADIVAEALFSWLGRRPKQGPS